MDYGFCCLTNMLFTPAHYMKQFHINHNADANNQDKEAGFDNCALWPARSISRHATS